ncbi:MAG: Coenzyme F420 hydrogenase/dehydrogenase, beta subunit C-terminal domain [Halobacteriota archaeon]|nr:Coenzyme F420 hydrogenase/dehydrogenase, beta subunit C-terminal domain [Halobacteriota archaeon]
MSTENILLPTFLECGFEKLDKEVISAGRCTSCGLCVGFCPKIEFKGDVPQFVEEYDTVCGVCYTFCPRTSLPVGEIEKNVFGEEREAGSSVGFYKDFITAKTTNEEIAKKAQDGGVVTTLLAAALEEGILDGVVVAGADEDWNPAPIVVTTKEDLIKAAGTKYTKSANILGVKEAIDSGMKNIGVCGTPCHIQAIRKLQTLDEPYYLGSDRIKLAIGLFCMESFGAGLLDFVGKQVGDVKDVDKFDIKKGDLLVTAKGEEKKFPLKEVSEYAMQGCSVCKDFSAELADISVGSVGSAAGYSTVIVRSGIGEELIKLCFDRGYLEKGEDAKLEGVKKLSEKKSSR